MISIESKEIIILLILISTIDFIIYKEYKPM